MSQDLGNISTTKLSLGLDEKMGTTLASEG